MKKMNKVCILGRDASLTQLADSVLQKYGMKPALPSRREALTPQAMTEALLKAHDCPPIEQVAEESQLAPLQVGPVWHALALDLMLGNVDQSFWGWADPSGIYLLDYWRTLEPAMLFVLVYESPKAALHRLAQAYDGNGAFAHLATNLLACWQAYNGALLRFYLRHPDRCVLVGSDQLTADCAGFIATLSEKLKRPLAAHTTATGECAVQLSATEPEDFILDAVVQQFPQVVQLHAELQSASSLPHIPAASAPDPIQLIESLLKQRSGQQRQSAGLLNNGKLAELIEENDLLLNQLHQVQEELERYYLENQRLKKGGKQGAGQTTPLRPFGAAERVKQQLTYRLGARMIAQSKTWGGRIMMIPALLGEIRDYRRDKAARAGQKMLPISQYADAKDAERVKQHLSYRLGKVMMDARGNPVKWLALPFSLASEAKTWRHEKGRT